MSQSQGTRANTPAIPTSFRCAVGKEWKKTEEFSNNQIKQWVSRSAKDRRVTPANSGISCREHSGELKTELQCHGPCNEWKPLSKFSRNSRVTGKNWCEDCVQWQVSAEPATTPYAPPGAERSAEESVSAHRTISDDEDDQYTVVNSQISGSTAILAERMARMNVTRPSSPTMNSRLHTSAASPIPRPAESVHAASVDGSQQSLPPHLQHGSSGVEGSPALSRAPHHFLPDFNGPSLSSFRTESRPSAPSTVDPVQAVGAARQATTFNAFDGEGRVSRVTKAATVASEAVRPSRAEARRENKSGWARPAINRKTQHKVPEYLKWDPKTTETGREDLEGSSDEC